VAFLRRRRQRLRQQNSAQDTSPHQLLIELYTFWRVLSTIEYRKEELMRGLSVTPSPCHQKGKKMHIGFHIQI
jgi:hypothetical protein